MWVVYVLLGWAGLSVLAAWIWRRHCVAAREYDEQLLRDWERSVGQ